MKLCVEYAQEEERKRERWVERRGRKQSRFDAYRCYVLESVLSKLSGAEQEQRATTNSAVEPWVDIPKRVSFAHTFPGQEDQRHDTSASTTTLPAPQRIRNSNPKSVLEPLGSDNTQPPASYPSSVQLFRRVQSGINRGQTFSPDYQANASVKSHQANVHFAAFSRNSKDPPCSFAPCRCRARVRARARALHDMTRHDTIRYDTNERVFTASEAMNVQSSTAVVLGKCMNAHSGFQKERGTK